MDDKAPQLSITPAAPRAAITAGQVSDHGFRPAV